MVKQVPKFKSKPPQLTITDTPLQAEALGILLAAKIAQLLQLEQPSFLTDCLPLAKAAATRRVDADQVH